MQAISGLGGVGKTSLALAYAHEFRDQYDAVIFSRADSLSSLNSGFQLLARQLALPQASSNDPELIKAAVRHHLNFATSAIPGITPYLFILDNADFGTSLTPQDLKLFLPNTPTGHLLLTTRSQAFHGSLGFQPKNVLRLDVMVPEDAERFFLDRVIADRATIDSGENLALTELAAALGYLPLALEQAAAYISQIGISFRSYLNLFRKEAIKHLEKSSPETGDYEKTVATTWQISFDEVEKASPAAADLLRLCAFTAPDAIPRELVMAAAHGVVVSLTTFFGDQQDADVLQEKYAILMSVLSRYSLVAQDHAASTFSVHRLVQAVTRWQLSVEQQRTWSDCSLLASARAFPLPDMENWPRCERLVGHVQAPWRWTMPIESHVLETIHLANNAARYLQFSGRYSEAMPLNEDMLAMTRQFYPADNGSLGFVTQ